MNGPTDRPTWAKEEQEVHIGSGCLLGGGWSPSYSTLKRYATSGKLSKYTNEVCTLESYQIGNSLFTTKEAWKRFLRRLNGEWLSE